MKLASWLKLATVGAVLLLSFSPLSLWLGRTFGLPRRDRQRVEDLAAIADALKAYFTYNHFFPRSDEVRFGQVWQTADIIYLKKIPLDPQRIFHSPYCYNNFGNLYLLCAQMESSDFRCPAGPGRSWDCNSCSLPDGRTLNYNYCLYDSY